MSEKNRPVIELVDRNKLIAEFMEYEITYPFRPRLSASLTKTIQDHAKQVIMSMPYYQYEIQESEESK